MLGQYGQWIPGTWPCHALRQEDCVPSLGACRDVDIRWLTATNPLMSTFFRFKFRSPHQNLDRGGKCGQFRRCTLPKPFLWEAVTAKLLEPLVVHRSKVIWNRRTFCWSLVRVKKYPQSLWSWKGLAYLRLQLWVYLLELSEPVQHEHILFLFPATFTYQSWGMKARQV
jgi:hypothetical protein